MRRPVVALALVGLLGTGCARSTGIGEDPVDPGRPVPGAVPAGLGPVTTRPPTTPLVLDDGTGAELCLGEVEDTAPPRCPGTTVPLAGWDLADAGSSQEQDGTRGGRYSLRGTFDGESLTVSDAVPAALYDTVRPEAVDLPPPSTPYTDTALDGIAEEVATLPGVLAVERDGAGHVLVDVVHDDGTLQAWSDERYGADVVVLTSALVPAG